MEDFLTKLGSGVSYITWPRIVFLVGFLLVLWKGFQLWRNDFVVDEADDQEVVARKKKDNRRAKVLFVFGVVLLGIGAWKIWMFGFNVGAAAP